MRRIRADSRTGSHRRELDLQIYPSSDLMSGVRVQFSLRYAQKKLLHNKSTLVSNGFNYIAPAGVITVRRDRGGRLALLGSK